MIVAQPEGWEWLNELPDEWVPGDDIREPTRIPSVNLAITMLASQRLGNDIIELVGMLIKENARYSTWFASSAKAGVGSDRDLALLSMLGHEQTRLVYEAWTSYAAAFESSGGLAAACDAQYAKLRDALRDAISTLSEARKSLDA